MCEGFAAAVDEEDDGRFQSLGGVHRHDPHLVAALVLLALHRRRLQLQRRDEGLQTRQARGFVIQCEGQEFIEDIADFGAEPSQELPPAAEAAEHTSIKVVHG